MTTASRIALRGDLLDFTDDPGFLTGLLPAGTGAPEPARHDSIGSSVEAYFGGDLAALDRVTVSYRPGGPFRRKAWDAMRAVKHVGFC